jgi:uncharacterized membrane protein YsdA (DUF1294 family)
MLGIQGSNPPSSYDILFYLLLVNGAAFILMGFDKMTAKLGSSRISEMWFFLFSLTGGVLRVVMDMFAFHHKTNKTSFQIKIAVAMVLVLPIVNYLLLR